MLYNYITLIWRVKAGASASTPGTLRKLAETLYTEASSLAGKASGDEGAASALATAVGNNEESGLRQALAALGDVPAGSDLTGLAKAVKDKYKIVQGLFDAVKQKNDQENKYATKGKEEYDRNQYKYSEYDVTSGGTLGSRLRLKAEELQTAATALHAKANTVGGTLSGLKTQAGSLATEAGDLISSPSSVNANSVIDNFDTLESAYKLLSETDKDKVSKKFEAVKNIYDRILNVKKANTLKNQADTIKGHASTLHGKANTLATATNLRTQESLKGLAKTLATAIGASDSEGLRGALQALSTADESDLKDLITRALDVINKYDAVDKAFKAVAAQATQYNTHAKSQYDQVTSQFSELKTKFNNGKCKAITPRFDKEYIR